mmetsp:Transcript_121307/g.288168  ORF Transcript_121307/g.288168 Transcript_121307/m.288168 type:complete len:222 (-) Transcript_121307:1670-2335(-)
MEGAHDDCSCTPLCALLVGSGQGQASIIDEVPNDAHHGKSQLLVVEAHERLVKDQDVGVADEGASQMDLHSLGGGQALLPRVVLLLVRASPVLLDTAHESRWHLQLLADVLHPLVAGQAQVVVRHPEDQVLLQALWQEIRRVHHLQDAQVGRHKDVPRRGRENPGHQLKQCGLALTFATCDGDDFALWNGGAHILQQGDLAVLAKVVVRDLVAQIDQPDIH